MPAVIPLVASGISAGAGLWNSKKQRDAQKQQQGQQQPLITAQTGLAKQTAQQGQQLFNTGMPALQAGAGYYGRLLSGDRAAMTSALAPEIGATTDVYRGAEKGLERTGAQGAMRDSAAADLNRDRAGKVASLVQGARPGAAAALTGIGQQATAAGVAGAQGAASMYSQLMNGLNTTADQQLRSRAYGDQRSDSLWKNVGGLFVDSYQAWKGQGTGGGNSPYSA